MKTRYKVFTFLAATMMLAAACTTKHGIGASGQAQMQLPPFPAGNLVNNGNFTGKVWLHMLQNTNDVYNTQIGNVTFAPGARSNWHHHPGGQILLVTRGNGLYQEDGGPVYTIKMGDVVTCPPNRRHWHGASASDTMTHVAISTNMTRGNVVWQEPVSDAVYARGVGAAAYPANNK